MNKNMATFSIYDKPREATAPSSDELLNYSDEI